jgi:hypothetical protein
MHDSAITALQELRIGICCKVTETVCLQPLKAFADVEASLFQLYVKKKLSSQRERKEYRIDKGDDEPLTLHPSD